MVCAPVPLKFTVLPVIVYAFAPGVNAPATPIVPLAASVRAPVELLVRLLYANAGIACATEPLKWTVLAVTVYTFVPGVKLPATPIVPLAATVRAPVELLVRLLYANAGIVCAPEPLKSTVLPITVYTFVPGVKAPAIATV